VVCFVNTYLLVSDLSGGKHYPTFEQLGQYFIAAVMIACGFEYEFE